VGEERIAMNRTEALTIRKDRVRKARDVAGYTQLGLAQLMKNALGGHFSYKIYRSVEEGTRDLYLYEAVTFVKLTGSTLQFLTGESSTIDVNEPKGLQRSWPVPVSSGSVALIAS
jgi:hypothetical protein